MQYYEKLTNSINNGVVSPVYLFYGEETYLRTQIIGHFKKGLLTAAADFNWQVLEGEQVDIDTVVAAASTLPFMADKRLVVVKDAPWFGNNKGRGNAAQPPVDAATTLQPLLDYLAQPLTSTCLIFDCANIDRRKKIVKAVEKAGQVVNFAQLSGRDLASWLNRQAASNGKELAGAAREMLVASSPTGLTGLVAEWEKLLTYVGHKKEITADDVQAVVHQSVAYRIFDMLDALSNRRYQQAVAVLKELQASDPRPQVILTMLAWQFRLILQVGELRHRGLSPVEMARLLKEKRYPVQKSLAVSRNFSSAQLIMILEQLAQLDYDTKTGRQEFYAGLEQLMLGLAVSDGY